MAYSVAPDQTAAQISLILVHTVCLDLCVPKLKIITVHFYKIELPHDKPNKMICAPSEDSDQPGHPPSLIRVFVVRSKDSQGPKVSSYGQR